jgi:hypothetical protein
VQTHLPITNLDQWRSKPVGKLHPFFLEKKEMYKNIGNFRFLSA